MNTMCVCISLSAYVTLFCLFSPKISIILLHPDKNVRKLTMNSATYKRAFKPVSSVASFDGRNNLPPGGGSQPDGPSGGPMSTTSNVLNLGESISDGEGKGPAANNYRSCGCFKFDCHYVGFAKCFESIWNFLRSLSFTSFKNWIGQCCSVGELGTTMARELDSYESAVVDNDNADSAQSQPEAASTSC